MPRCLCLLHPHPYPKATSLQLHWGMVWGCVPAPGWEQCGVTLPPCAVQPSCASREAVKPHLPFFTTAVVELMSFCSPFWQGCCSRLGGMKLCFPALSHAMVARWWVRQPLSATGSCLLALWSLLKNVRNLHFTELNPRLSVLPVALSLPWLCSFALKP